MKIRHYNVVFKPEPEGGFTVTVPSLPGCVTYGKNIFEAKEMAKEAIEVYIASLNKHNEPVPSDEDIKDVPKGTLSAILRGASISREKFLAV